jgi:hypothetical protein
MTWYAQQLFAEPNSGVIEALRDRLGLSNAIYYVPHLLDMQTEEQVVDGILLRSEGSVNILRTTRGGPQLPPKGLLVVREMCASGDDVTEWFGEDAVFWDDLNEEAVASPDPLLDFAIVFESAPDWWRNVAPPPAILSRFQAVAETTKSMVAYYTCHTWGGDIECAFGWLWDGQRGTSSFYRAVIATDEGGKETTGFYTDTAGALAIDSDGERFIVNGDVLTLLLLHFGLLLRDGYFALHTRSFPWERYKLKSNAA